MPHQNKTVQVIKIMTTIVCYNIFNTGLVNPIWFIPAFFHTVIFQFSHHNTFITTFLSGYIATYDKPYLIITVHVQFLFQEYIRYSNLKLHHNLNCGLFLLLKTHTDITELTFIFEPLDLTSFIPSSGVSSFRVSLCSLLNAPCFTSTIALLKCVMITNCFIKKYVSFLSNWEINLCINVGKPQIPIYVKYLHLAYLCFSLN